MKRFLTVAPALFLAAAVTALTWVAVQIALQSNRDEARTADAIVVLGAAEYMGRPSPVLQARLDHALYLYRQALAPLIVTTGGHGAKSPFTEAEAARDYLVARGIPSESVLLENEGTSTLQSAAGAAQILHQHNLNTCIVVSDGYHVFRAKRILEEHGIQAYGSPRPSEDPGAAEAAKLYVRQAAAYWLWQFGMSR